MHHEDHTSPVAVVTGGAQGIGLATATLLAERGFTVALADLDGALAAQAAGALNSAGYTATASTVDVSQRSDVERLMAEVISVYGRIDVLINNAGIAGNAAPIAEVTDEDWEMMLRVDLTSVFLCCRAVHAAHAGPPARHDRQRRVDCGEGRQSAHGAVFRRPRPA